MDALKFSLPCDPGLLALICDSYRRLLGVPLVAPGLSEHEVAKWLYEDAPFCILAHEHAAEPRFVFANRAAQRCFGYGWGEFVGMPSRLSAEEANREERQQLLDAVARRGYATGYRGLRVAKSGKRFWIEDVTVWNLVDAEGRVHGQAATYRKITPQE